MRCRTNRAILRALCFVIIVVAFMMLLTTLNQGRDKTSKIIVKQDIERMPELVQFDRFISDDMLPPDHAGVVWKNAPNFIPLEKIQRTQLQRRGEALPQSYREKLPEDVQHNQVNSVRHKNNTVNDTRLTDNNVNGVRHKINTVNSVRHKNNSTRAKGLHNSVRHENNTTKGLSLNNTVNSVRHENTAVRLGINNFNGAYPSQRKRTAADNATSSQRILGIRSVKYTHLPKNGGKYNKNSENARKTQEKYGESAKYDKTGENTGGKDKTDFTNKNTGKSTDVLGNLGKHHKNSENTRKPKEKHKSDFNNEVEIPKDIPKDVQPKKSRGQSRVHQTLTNCHQVAPRVHSFYTQNDIYCLREDATVYFRTLGLPVTCLIEGTDFPATNRKSNKECVCKAGWFGQECSMPDVVFNSEYPYHFGVAIREVNRRIIYAMPVNHEFELVEVKVNELGSVVDVFLLLESNITAAGQPKRTLLLDKLSAGFLQKFHHKIVYLQLTYFPREARGDGWVMDSLLRNYIGDVTLRHGVLHDVRPDDVIIMHDADELPIREALLFLKVHDGYPEPFGFKMHHRVFGFFWRSHQSLSNIYGGATLKFLNYILRNETYLLRNPAKVTNNDPGLVERYRHDHGGRVHAWSFGSDSRPAGWHCSWCFNAQGVRYKMLSAHVSDTPRWGSHKNLTGLPFINSLISTGHWFDNKTTYIRTDYATETHNYAPEYVLRHHERFRHLLEVEAATNHRSEEADLFLFDNKIT